LLYSEWVTRCKSWATSAWKLRVFLVMAMVLNYQITTPHT
jgi:hypothetical protein